METVSLKFEIAFNYEMREMRESA